MASKKESGRGVSRMEENLRRSKEAKEFYECHQFYTTIIRRLNSRGKCEAALSKGAEGARFLVDNKQFESGLDLALLYVEVLEKSFTRIDDSTIKTLSYLHKNIPQSLAKFFDFQNRAVRWSATCEGNPKTGNRVLRNEFAANMWNAQNYGEARQQFLYGSNGKHFAQLLVEMSVNHGRPEECDMFLAQAVLQLLTIKSIDVAKDVFQTYLIRHPKLSPNLPCEYPLVNFLHYLMTAINNKNVNIYKALLKSYEPSLSRDPSFNHYYSVIGTNYFDIKPPPKKAGGQGLFSEILNSFMGGSESQQNSKPPVKVNKKETTPTPPPAVDFEDDLD